MLKPGPPARCRHLIVQWAPENNTGMPTAPYSYDQVPYLNRTHVRTHPDRMATMAALLGLQPPPLDACRVLELGCANGHNLLPMALNLPGSRFVGVDLSARQIADGQAAVAELGLTNLSLHHASILDIDDSYGPFDYILCHGVYSWVPSTVQDKILAVCRAHLAPQGVAFVSYNTLPGWHDKLRVREMLLHHVRHITDARERIRRSREFIQALAEIVAPPEATELSAYGAVLRAEAEIVATQDDDYIYHEYLEDSNLPIYFHEFAQRVEQHELQYLGDADRGLKALESVIPPAAQPLAQHYTTGLVALEQFFDFLSNRTFRSSLLVQGEAPVDRSIPSYRLKPLWVRSALRPTNPEADLASTAFEAYAVEGSSNTYSTAHPVTKAALQVLANAHPRAVAFNDLVTQACALTYADPAIAQSRVTLTREADALGQNLLQGYTHDNSLVDLHAFAPPLALTPSDHPSALPSARFQAIFGRNVTNPYHHHIHLDTLSWYLVPFLDGTRDYDALVALVLANASLAVERDGQELTDDAQKPSLVRDQVETCLHTLAHLGLLLEP
jgi:methyltransferase-like protein/2-polyprenyl-3-methyl-5-hydroxy-6-metoxy-1,4-benzoquinol methylase